MNSIEAAKELGVTAYTVRNFIKYKILEATKKGLVFDIPESSIEKLKMDPEYISRYTEDTLKTKKDQVKVDKTHCPRCNKKIYGGWCMAHGDYDDNVKGFNLQNNELL